MKKIVQKVRRKLGLIDEMTDLNLRREFKSLHNIDVGLHSYGCFDRRRIDPNVTIGRYCSFAPTAQIFRRNHGISFLGLTPYFYNSRLGLVDKDTVEYRPLVIEDDVWIGHGASILPSVSRVGRGAVIAAGAIVTKDVAPYAMVAGNPARELRKRFDPSVIAQIEQTRWWGREPADLKRLFDIAPDAFLGPAAHGERLVAMFSEASHD